MARWLFLPDEDPYRGPPSVGFLQLQEGQPYQVWLTWNSWNFAWVTFLKEPEQARNLVDALATRLQEMSRDTSDQGLQRLADYLEEITAQSAYPVPQEMDENIHEDLRRRHGQQCGLRVVWPFREPPVRQLGSTFLGVWPGPQGMSGVWITMDAGNTFRWIAFYTQALDASWASLALEQAIRQGGFMTAEGAEALLLEAVNRSESPVPVEMGEDIQNAIREDFEFKHGSPQAETPGYTRDLSVFRRFYESSHQQAEATMQSLQLALLSGQLADEGYDAYLLQKLCVLQRLYCLQHARIYYVEPSGLKLCEALLSPSSDSPTFPAEPMWIQPLAPLPFRGGFVRGIFISDAYNKERVDLLDLASPSERARARRYSERKHGMYQIEIFYDNPKNRTKFWQGKTLLFGEYDTRNQTWSRIAEGYECPSGACHIESLGEQDILLQCDECQREFTHWKQWFEVFFLGIEGKLRRPSDTTPFEELEVPFEQKGMPAGKRHKGKVRNAKPRLYHATIIRYDASYFQPARRRGKRGSLRDSHIVLTTEEALKEGALELDMDGVLIRDTTPRAAFTRQLVHPRFKKAEAQVKFKPDMPQLVSLRTWKARREAREAALHKQKDVYASAYEQQEDDHKKDV
jgi:hypothetical protein